MSVLALAMAGMLASAAQSTFPPENNCDLPDDRQVVTCTDRQYKAWDRSLNAEYQAAMNRSPTEQRPLLTKAQRLWLLYRDANCAIGFAHGGTISGYLGEQCLLNMTRDRAKELHTLHDEDDD